ncbi:RHS repeat-associated core domain-containing protein [Dyella sp. 2RAB6]|uniref:RHS repeat-associated core domain-containing protein n=1 Tax=Dyella sp. 2RAB6 TaxID=3232992 RepID=UPI003F922C34
MSGIKDRFHITALGWGLVALSGVSLASILSAQQTIALDADVSMDTLTALGDLEMRPLILPDGRAMTMDAKQLVLRSKGVAGEQKVPLPERRVGATAAVLPDGRVLIWGGADMSGKLLRDGLWFDPQANRFEPAELPALPAGVGQAFTVLSDGQVLVTGGWNASNRYLEQATLWDPRTGSGQALGVPFGPRYGQGTMLREDGTVVFSGGLDEQLRPMAGRQSFDPVTWRFEAKAGPLADQALLKVVATHPGSDQEAVAPGALVGVRFSIPVENASVSAANVSLIGPAGPVGASIAGVQGGRLAFVIPDEDLLPATHYTVVMSGVKDGKGQVLPFTTFKFTTAALGAHDQDLTGQQAGNAAHVTVASDARHGGASDAASGITYYRSTGMDKLGHAASLRVCRPEVLRKPQLCRDKSYFDDGAWYPGQDNAGGPDGGHWRVNLPDMAPEERVAALVHDRKARAKAVVATESMVTGQVRLVDGRPIARVRVSVGKAYAYTDEQGGFLLSGVPRGHQSLFVDGSGAGDASHRYGQFEVGIDVDGAEARLPYRMYLPRILDRDRIEVPSPTTHDMVVTHPDMPGLEVHIPAGTVFRDHNGKIVTELAIVPMPTDRAPYPTPVNFPVYFSLQPGGAVVQNVHADVPQGITLTYPNYGRVKPGYPADFIAYSPVDGWRTYGKGQITPDGTQLKAESGVRLTALTSGSWSMGTQHPGDPNAAKPGGPCCGDPVDLLSGTLVENHTDVAINDVMPIQLTRQWHGVGHSALMDASTTQDSRSFGSWRSNYDMYVNGVWANPGVRLPDGNWLAPFTQIDSNPGSDGTWVYSGNVASFAGATLDAPVGATLCDQAGMSFCYVLGMPNGTHYYFDIYSGLYEIRDRFDNRIRIVRSGGLIQQIISPSGRYLTFQYNSDNNVSQIADNTGRTWAYSYHNASFPVAGWSAAGPGSNPQQATMYFLDKVTYPDQTFATYKYNEDFTLPPIGGGSGCAAAMPSTLSSMIDRNGATVMTNTYCGEQVSKQVLANGGVYLFSYLSNAGGAETDVTDPLGSVRKTIFDVATGYPASVTQAAGTPLAQTTTYSRNSFGQVLSVTDPFNRQTAYTYDGNGNPLTITQMSGTSEAVTRQMTWTSDNLPLTVIDELGRTTQFTYAQGCLVSAKDPMGQVSSAACNERGLPIQVTDSLGHQTKFSYQGNDLSTVTDALGRVTTFQVDALGRTFATIDPLGRAAVNVYDTNGWLKSATGPDGQVVSYQYDNEGHLTQVLLPNQGTVAYQYFPGYLLKQRVDAMGQPEGWTYDSAGNVLSYTDRKGQVTAYASRDALGRFTKLTYADGATITADIYDSIGRLKQFTDSAYGTVTRSYDDFDRLTGESTPQGVVAYSYYANGLRKTMSAASQALVSYQYNDNDQLQSLTQGSEAVNFTYDAANRRQTLMLPNGIKATYSYDDANELVGLTYATAGNVAIGDLSYTYDAMGQRTGRSGSFISNLRSNATAQSGQFDLNNRQTQFNGQSLTYDANGNLTSDGTSTYVWNARNQLVQVKQGAATVASYSYDSMGRRVAKTIQGVATSYLYDGPNAVQESAGGVVNPILTGLNVDERFARNDVGGRSYFLADAVGSTVALTDSNANVLQRYSYDSYGNASMTGAFTNPYQFTGRENDGGGLYYYRARYYAPAMGRFISEDALGMAAGLDGYAYADNNPVSIIDPSGFAGGVAPQDAKWRVIFKSMMLGLAAHKVIQADVALALPTMEVKMEQRTYNIFNKNYGVVDLMIRSGQSDPWSVFEIKPISQWDCSRPGNIEQLKDYVRSLNEDGVPAVAGHWGQFFPNEKMRTVNIPTGITVGHIPVDGNYIYGSPDNNGMIYYATGDAVYPRSKK